MKKIIVITAVAASLLFTACTQETQNKIGRSIQNWTGTNGVLDVYMGGKLVKRFIKIDKLTTATSTDGNVPRNYRYGYGYLDLNENYVVDKGEKKLYFEISNFATPYVFYENPKR
jgi:predicted small secreted protein